MPSPRSPEPLPRSLWALKVSLLARVWEAVVAEGRVRASMQPPHLKRAPHGPLSLGPGRWCQWWAGPHSWGLGGTARSFWSVSTAFAPVPPVASAIGQQLFIVQPALPKDPWYLRLGLASLECAVPPEFCIWGADVPSPSVFLALRAGAWGLLLLPQGGSPLFSTFDTWRPSLVTGQVVGMCARSPLPRCSASALCPPGPAFPAPTWDQSEPWDHGWSTRVTLVHSASLGP